MSARTPTPVSRLPQPSRLYMASRPADDFKLKIRPNILVFIISYLSTTKTTLLFISFSFPCAFFLLILILKII